MRRLKNFSMLMICLLVIVCSAVVFTGCKGQSKKTHLFVFASEGGCVQVNDEADKVEFGDEGDVFEFKQKTKVTLTAIASQGYNFVKWEYADGLDKRQEDFSTQPQITLAMDKCEIVIRAVFASNGSIDYNVSYANDENKYTILPEEGYTNTVALGEEFKFKVSLTEEYFGSNVVVKANNAVLVADSKGVYTIASIHTDIQITVEVTKKVIEVTYQFNLRFEDAVADLMGSDIYNFPQSISFTVLNTDEKLEEYDSAEFIVSTSFGDEVNARALFADMNHELYNLELGFTAVKCLTVGAQPFMTLDGNDVLHIDWSLISSATINEVLIEVE